MANSRANKKVLTVLNDVLSAELTAINQYFLHARMCRNWGYLRLNQIIYKESIDEMKHADDLIERILYLGGVPNVQRLYKINIGETVKEILESDLALEYEALPRLQEGVVTCREEKDDGSRVLLEQILIAEEEHVDWLEAQLELIEQMGEANYLAQQVREDPAA